MFCKPRAIASITDENAVMMLSVENPSVPMMTSINPTYATRDTTEVTNEAAALSIFRLFIVFFCTAFVTTAINSKPTARMTSAHAIAFPVPSKNSHKAVFICSQSSII